jgi:hypothetical protein
LCHSAKAAATLAYSAEGVGLRQQRRRYTIGTFVPSTLIAPYLKKPTSMRTNDKNLLMNRRMIFSVQKNSLVFERLIFRALRCA